MIYPALVYRCPGAYARAGGSYACFGVNSDEEAIQALEDGWFETLPEAIAAHDNPKSSTLTLPKKK